MTASLYLRAKKGHGVSLIPMARARENSPTGSFDAARDSNAAGMHLASLFQHKLDRLEQLRKSGFLAHLNRGRSGDEIKSGAAIGAVSRLSAPHFERRTSFPVWPNVLYHADTSKGIANRGTRMAKANLVPPPSRPRRRGVSFTSEIY
jgi:hypothetical protein